MPLPTAGVDQLRLLPHGMHGPGAARRAIRISRQCGQVDSRQAAAMQPLIEPPHGVVLKIIIRLLRVTQFAAQRIDVDQLLIRRSTLVGHDRIAFGCRNGLLANIAGLIGAERGDQGVYDFRCATGYQWQMLQDTQAP